ncbi:peptidoglycan-binding domain-containing protein [Iningainema tapete]|uniref:Peptidoglycan-binding protein n=1 Tax=Iningainema tapete BLCC-T55 TaxID=2748662 RepID=A0A8J6XQP8_9CYAN|nr:peptidoglycan-binding protein [Iningainema tapete]MBD2776515.1 peptidoglycan-binding protein [Iningainema tapete BLCC-T55]
MTSTTDSSNFAAQLNKPVLKEGSRGEAVKELQKLLLKYGAFVYLGSNGACVFPGEEVIDGIFGLRTTKAVKIFESKMFLPQDGIVEDRTWRSLYKGAPVDMPILKKGSKGELIKRIQERLAVGDYYNGAIDGDFGSRTETAVKGLQTRTGLPVDGVIGDRTWFELSKINTVFC